ncbi:transcription repressor OFP15-like [Cornus florida]|uniref:transcription repressor OFP15-like n=1 Tax=Cornus florida TaxID=4283 RepID=UPI00289D5762|nr:transcription repressor OFP15-like [Cornus florida]XP_059646601.1 transcription repressor OFP15-like [Cornus florida]
MKLPFPFKNTETITSSWPWPSCGSPKTLSFRGGNDELMTVNEVAAAETVVVEDSGGGESIETVIRGLWSERLFFEPVETSSILEVVKSTDEFPYKETTEIMAMDSDDPYVDFKRSMEEMVEAHGLKDWECLEELLSWYLRVNGKSNHDYIVVAFVDLLLGLAFAAASASEATLTYDDRSTSTCTTSPFSFSSSTSPCLSSLVEAEDEIEKTVDNASSSSSSSSSSDV